MSSNSTPQDEPDLPQAFRQKVTSRLQRLIEQNLTRLEKEGKNIHVRDLSLQTGILLTKHAELTGIAPPSSVHNQTTVISGIDQQSARAILSGKGPSNTAYSSTSEKGQKVGVDRSTEIPPVTPQRPLPGLSPRLQALANTQASQALAKTDPFSALKHITPDPSAL